MTDFQKKVYIMLCMANREEEAIKYRENCRKREQEDEKNENGQ